MRKKVLRLRGRNVFLQNTSNTFSPAEWFYFSSLSALYVFFFLNLQLAFTRLLCSPPTKQMSSCKAGAATVGEVRLTGWFLSVPISPLPQLTQTHNKIFTMPCIFGLPDMWKRGKQRWRAWWRSVQSCGWWRYCKARSRTWQGTDIKEESMRIHVVHITLH